MAKDRSLVRASDIGAWAFCRRAWWLANVQGAEHGDPAALHRGVASHEEHGQSVLRAERLRRAGLTLLAGALLLAGLLLLLRVVMG